MIEDVKRAQEFLRNKFNGLHNVKVGVYSIPTVTSKGKAYMKVEVTPDMQMTGFDLFKDETLTQRW